MSGSINKIRSILKHRFVRKAVVFQFANGFASVMQSLAGIVLARVMKPELFGQYSLAFSVASVASVFLAAGVQEALMPGIARAHARGDGREVLDGFAYWTKWIGISAVSTLLLVVILPIAASQLYGDTAIGIYAGVILIAAFFSSGVLSLAQVGAQVSNRIGVLSGLTLGDMIARYGASAAMVVVGWQVIGASAGHLVGALIMVAAGWFVFASLVRRDPLIPALGDIVRRAGQVPVALHFDTSAWVWVDRNLGMLFQALPVAVVGLAVSAVSVSYFKLAFGYVNTGMALLGPVSILLNTEFAKMQVGDPADLKRNFIYISLIGCIVGGAIAGLAALVGPWVFRFIYGSTYLPSVPLVYGLVIYGALFGLGVGLGPMWRTLGRVKTSVAINIVVLAVGLPLGYASVRIFGAWGGVYMVTLWYAAAHIASFAYLLRQLRSSNS